MRTIYEVGDEVLVNDIDGSGLLAGCRVELLEELSYNTWKAKEILRRGENHPPRTGTVERSAIICTI